MRQADIFLQGEGDAWFDRNRDRMGQRDPVFDMIKDAGIKPKRVLEVGCANGWRLAKLRDEYGCYVMGIEPSKEACADAATQQIYVHRDIAGTSLSPADAFDLIIYGFCLYLTEPQDWFRIAAETDLPLVVGGHLIIHDFADVLSPYARRYEHHPDILSYHFDFADLWLAHPLYSLVRRVIDGNEMITMMRKNRIDTLEVRP